MSKYTTEVRFICESLSGLDESLGYSNVNSIINNAIPKIFNFAFPIFDESYRHLLEEKILKHFYTREIGLETYGLWKLKLETKLNEIMPYYNRMYKSELLEYNPLYTHDLTRSSKKSQEYSSVSSNTNSTSSVDNGTVATENTNLYSDTPQGQISHLEDKTYLTNATQDNTNEVTHAESSANSNGNSNESGNSLDDYIERVIGREGKDASEMLMNFRKTFLNIDMMIINELEELFIQLW